MLAQDVMTRGVECTAPDALLQVAALKMKELDIGVLPVCDEGRLVGMITDGTNFGAGLWRESWRPAP